MRKEQPALRPCLSFVGYRDFDGALAEQRRLLAEEIERLDAERARFQSNLRRRDLLFERLRELDHQLGLSAPKLRSFWSARRKTLLALAALVGATGGAGALIAMPADPEPPTRSLLLMVKYVDRVGTELQMSKDRGDVPLGGCYLNRGSRTYSEW